MITEAAPDSLIKPLGKAWYQPLSLQLKALQKQRRLPHAVLLSFPGETSELAFLWHLSMHLLCRDSHHGQPCGQCASCHLMLANAYPDFKLVALEYDAGNKKVNKNIKVEQVRGLIREVYLTHSYDNLKIAVIYPADKMSMASANSLLKTLEEPAENVLIILATHQPGRIPVTIRSRCQPWNLCLPATAEALAWLQAEGIGHDNAAQYLELANGDPSLAARLHAIQYADLVADFKKQFTQYLKNQIDVVALCRCLTVNQTELVRRLVFMVIKAYCQKYSGLQDAPIKKAPARAMLDLMVRMQRQLMTEENNLDTQLQLEDVLIAIKQIIISQSANHSVRLR